MDSVEEAYRQRRRRRKDSIDIRKDIMRIKHKILKLSNK